VGASQALKDASSTYFASAAGQTNTALTRIFRPGRVYEYGCACPLSGYGGLLAH
jgi:hypothetical protein